MAEDDICASQAGKGSQYYFPSYSIFENRMFGGLFAFCGWTTWRPLTSVPCVIFEGFAGDLRCHKWVVSPETVSVPPLTPLTATVESDLLF